MENVTRSTELHDFHLAPRKAEEAVGPLGISDQPSEREFISCLRNGLILCNAINKIQPGSVPKVVGNHLPTQSVIWDSQPFPAYQYCENVGNFLVAVEELKLPAFKASDVETLPSNLQDIVREQTHTVVQSASVSKGNRPAKDVVEDIKSLLSQTKREFEDLQAQLLNDLKQLDYYLLNWFRKPGLRDVYYWIGVLEGNIRVYCRIRPTFNVEAKDVIDFIGEDGSLVIVDPSKRDERKVFRFNREYGPTTTKIRSHYTNDGLSLPDATLHSMKATIDVLNLMKHGDGNRAVNFTAMNNQSSRSHSVLTVHVHGKDTSGNIIHNRLYLVDLAGRGHAKTLMFAHVSPEGDDFGETLGTLKFARRVSGIELGATCLNKQSSEVREFKQQFLVYNSEDLDFMQIENLKKALIELPKDVCKFSPLDSVTPHRYQELLEGQVVSTSNAHFRNSKSPVGSSDPTEVMLVGQATEIPVVKPPKSPEPHLISINYRQTALYYEVSKDHQKPSRAKSPPSSAQQQPPSLVGYATKIPTIKSPKSPEQQCLGRNVHTALGTEASRDCQAPIIVKSAQGKGSQIMKSLRTIGKLINGFVKRMPLSCLSVMCYRKAHGAKLQEPAKDRSTYRGRNMISDPKSPDETNARALRRQSLTGIPSTGSDRVCRSSLGNGGKSNVVPIMKLTKET
ncbi:hypothetical protein Ancab_033474 [Ancistrocladus abbreviatus]